MLLCYEFQITNGSQETYVPSANWIGGGYGLLDVASGYGEVEAAGVCRSIAAGELFLLNDMEPVIIHGCSSVGGNVLWFDRSIVENNNISTVSRNVSAVLWWMADRRSSYRPCAESYKEIHRVFSDLQALSAIDGVDKELFAYSYIWELLAKLYQDIQRQGLQITTDGSADKLRHLSKTITYMHQHYSSQITLSDLAKVANTSVPNFCAVFRKTMGIAPMKYLQRIRIEKAQQLLKHTEMKIIQVAGECGFNTMSHFTKTFRSIVGVSPSDYRKDGGG